MGERIGLDVLNMLYDTSNAISEQFAETGDYEGLKFELYKTMALEVPFTEEEYKAMKADDLTEALYNASLDSFKRKTERMAQVANPVIRNVYENQGDRYENIVVPVTDGKKTYNIICNLKDAYESESKELVKSFEKSVLLHSIDESWKEHLREMDDLRQSVQNASYENKDPLLIYKLESFNLFKTMVDDMNRKSVSILMRGQIPMREPEHVRQAHPEQKTDFSKYRTQKDEIAESRRVQGEVAGRDTREQKREPVRSEKTVGRNEPCPCGSGKKYKVCCGRN